MSSALSSSIQEIRDWILSKHPDLTAVDMSEDLIESRLIDSLSFVEFTFVIESASGVTIDMEKIDIDDFRTLTAVEKAFFATR